MANANDNDFVETLETPGGSIPVASLVDLGKIIADGIAAGIAQNAPAKKVSFGQYDPKSTFHPDKKKRVKLTREVFQNGFRCDEDKLFDKEISLLNKINRGGRYLDRKVEVIMREDGVGGVPGIEIRYSNQTVDQRMELKSLFTNFQDLLNKILMAQEIAEENEDLKRSR